MKKQDNDFCEAKKNNSKQRMYISLERPSRNFGEAARSAVASNSTPYPDPSIMAITSTVRAKEVFPRHISSTFPVPSTSNQRPEELALEGSSTRVWVNQIIGHGNLDSSCEEEEEKRKRNFSETGSKKLLANSSRAKANSKS